MSTLKNTSGNSRSQVLSAFLTIESNLRKYLRRFLVNHQDIEDVVQETFLRSFNAEKSRDIRSPESFLFRVARNLALTEISRKSTKLMSYVADLDSLQVIDSKSDLEQQAYRQQQLDTYIRALQALPPQCQRVFVMCKVYGFSHKEIAKRLNISVSTVEKHLVKGLQRCQKYMSSQDATQDLVAEKNYVSARTEEMQ